MKAVGGGTPAAFIFPTLYPWQCCNYTNTSRYPFRLHQGEEYFHRKSYVEPLYCLPMLSKVPWAHTYQADMEIAHRRS